MKRTECLLLMISMMSLAVAAQTPKAASNGEDAPHARDRKPEIAQPGVAKTEAAKSEAVQTDLLPESDAGTGQAAAAAQSQIAEASAVSTSSSASFSPLPADASAANVPAANVELQSEIQRALSKDPALSGVVVSASADGIDLTGSAGNSRERLAAWRLAESYARGKQVQNHIVVNRQIGAAPANAHPENGAPASNPAPAAASSPGLQNNRQ